MRKSERECEREREIDHGCVEPNWGADGSCLCERARERVRVRERESARARERD